MFGNTASADDQERVSGWARVCGVLTKGDLDTEMLGDHGGCPPAKRESERRSVLPDSLRPHGPSTPDQTRMSFRQGRPRTADSRGTRAGPPSGLRGNRLAAPARLTSGLRLGAAGNPAACGAGCPQRALSTRAGDREPLSRPGVCTAASRGTSLSGGRGSPCQLSLTHTSFQGDPSLTPSAFGPLSASG